jgi:hypothetical protein
MAALGLRQRKRTQTTATRVADQPKQAKPAGDGRQARGLLAVATQLNRVTAAVRRRRGLSEAGLIADWAMIVGDGLAAQCAPQRLVRGAEGVGGTLHVRVTGPLALELQHLEPLVVERINGYFGYRAVARLALRQGPVTPPANRPGAGRTKAPPAPAADAEKRLQAMLAGIDDDELREALARFGRGVMARRPVNDKETGDETGN